MLTLLRGIAERVAAGKIDPAGVPGWVKAVVHGPLADLVVRRTPTQADDLLLAWLREEIPAP